MAKEVTTDRGQENAQVDEGLPEEYPVTSGRWGLRLFLTSLQHRGLHHHFVTTPDCCPHGSQTTNRSSGLGPVKLQQPPVLRGAASYFQSVHHVVASTQEDYTEGALESSFCSRGTGIHSKFSRENSQSGRGHGSSRGRGCLLT